MARSMLHLALRLLLLLAAPSQLLQLLRRAPLSVLPLRLLLATTATCYLLLQLLAEYSRCTAAAALHAAAAVTTYVHREHMYALAVR
jgi:hypothetical protein